MYNAVIALPVCRYLPSIFCKFNSKPKQPCWRQHAGLMSSINPFLPAQLYASPSLEFQHPPVSRWTLPVRAVDFSADGKLIAAAGDDGLIKILELKTNQVGGYMIVSQAG